MKNIDQELGFPGKSTFEAEPETSETKPESSEEFSLDTDADLGLSGFNYISTEKIAEDLTCLNSQDINADPLGEHMEGPEEDDEDLEAEIERINNREKIEMRQQIDNLKRRLNERDLEVVVCQNKEYSGYLYGCR